MTTEEPGERAAAPGRIALRSPLEAFLWIFITRLIALLTATRLPAPDEVGDDAPAADTAAGDPDRARRVTASRTRTAVGPAGSNPSNPSTPRPSSAGPAKAASTPDTARTVAVTAAATVVAGAAAFAAGRRRGRR